MSKVVAHLLEGPAGLDEVSGAGVPQGMRSAALSG